MPIFDPALAEKIRHSGIIAVLVIDDENDAVPLATALQEGGVNAIELTLRTPVAWAAMERIKASVPEIIIGLGTILTPEQIEEASHRGAAFGVSPGINRRVMDTALQTGFSFAPGVATPSDIEMALEYECKLLKFFPAEPSGGLVYLKSMSAPYAHLGLSFIPLGGLNAQNIGAYLAEPSIAALGGSWLAPRDLIAARNWREITRIASETIQIIRASRALA